MFYIMDYKRMHTLNNELCNIELGGVSMDLYFVFISILPILLFITVSFFVVNWVKMRHLFTPTSIGTLSIIVIMSLVLTWYYYPVSIMPPNVKTRNKIS